MIYLLLYALLLLMILPGIHIRRSGGPLINITNSLKQMNALRGFFAVIIVFSHCTLTLETLPAILLPLNKISTFVVGYFFLLSGYGLAFSVANKDGYLQHFPMKILHLVTITVVFSLISELLLYLFTEHDFSVRVVSWYMVALIGLYCVFYLFYGVFPKNRKMRLVGVSVAVFLLMLLILAVFPKHRTYYISEMAFPLGILLYEFRDELEKIFKRKLTVVVLILSIFVFSFFALFTEKETFPDLLLRNLMMIPFGVLLLVICSWFSFNNRILGFFTSNSLYIFLLQFCSIPIVKYAYSKFGRPLDVLYFFVSLLLTCFISIVVSDLNRAVKMIFRNPFYKSLNSQTFLGCGFPRQ